MRIIFLVQSLGCGGAERQLLLLAAGLSRRHTVSIVTFHSREGHFTTAAAPNIPVHTLEKLGRWDIAGFLMRFLRLLGRERPDAIYSFMGPASLVALTARWVARDIKIVWGIRSSNVDWSRYDFLSRLVRRGECLFSRCADLAICNSDAGRRQALLEGFKSRRIAVIPNGIDAAVFTPQPDARRSLRARWNIADNVTLIGTVARLDPMKGYEIFLEAASKIVRKWPNVCFIAAGDGTSAYTAQLHSQARVLGLDGRMIWAGRVDEVTAYYSAMDFFTLASISEGFPNALGEAMACGLPCVASDVGDVADIVADAALVVPAGNSDRLAEAWLFLLSQSAEDRLAMGSKARERVTQLFGVARAVAETERLLLELTG